MIFSGIVFVLLVSGCGNFVNGLGMFIFLGVFVSKNMFVLFCGIVIFIGLVGMFDCEMLWWQCLICVVGCGLGVIVGIFVWLVGVNLVIGVVCVMVVGLLVIGWLLIGGWWLVMIVMFGVVVMVGVVVVFVMQDDVNNLLISVGKLFILLGCVYLWDCVGQVIVEYLLVGYGYQVFWGLQFEDVFGFYCYVDVVFEFGFYFYNFYYEIVVEMGVIGVLVMGGMLVIVLLVVLW